jgi:hypothetical protein
MGVMVLALQALPQLTHLTLGRHCGDIGMQSADSCIANFNTADASDFMRILRRNSG